MILVGSAAKLFLLIITNVSLGMRCYSLDTDLHTSTMYPGDQCDQVPGGDQVTGVYPVLTPYHLSAISHPHVLMTGEDSKSSKS